MSKKKKSAPLKDDFTVAADEDICYFKENYKPEGKRLSLFSFNSPKSSETECQNSTSDNTNNVDIKSSDSSNTVTATLQADNLSTLNNSNNKTDTIDENVTDLTNGASAQNHSSLSNSNIDLLNNLESKSTFGSLPAIDGEPADLRRSYSLRRSTVKKLDEIKNSHPDACVSVSTVVDIAISHYYDCIFRN